MQVSPQVDRFLHQKLPIDDDEKVLGLYKHHWFIYVLSWTVGIAVAVLVMVVTVVLTLVGGADIGIEGRESQVIAIGGLFALIVLAGSFIPVYLRAQEQLVLTEESLLQILQPSLFANKVDQLGLQHIADVSVRQDLFGMMFGYGNIIVETPGEQNNFVFIVVPNADKAAREIMAAHEDYVAALEGGYMPSALSDRHRQAREAAQQPPAQIDPEQYQQFLAYQQMVNQQRQQNTGPSDPAHGQPGNGPGQHSA